MNIQPLHSNFKMPTRATELAGGFDLYMPEAGTLLPHQDTGLLIPLGFAAAIPEGSVALLLPRSGTGAKFGVSLNNTVGVIDADYRGEWKASLRLKNSAPFSWEAGERLLQFVIVPVFTPNLVLVDSLDDTERGASGFGGSGK